MILKTTILLGQQGIPNLPDLTHPNELIKFGEQTIKYSLLLTILVIVLGVVIAIFNFSQRQNTEQSIVINQWLKEYGQLIKIVQHLILILVLIVPGFFLCTTLSNRYHHWEQAKVAKMTAGVSANIYGENSRLEQVSPAVRYRVTEPFTEYRYVDGNMVEVKTTREVDKYLAIASSQIDVQINQATEPQNNKIIYVVNFQGNYQVKNLLSDVTQFFLEMPPPQNYSLLQVFRVEQNKQRMPAINPGDFGFPFQLKPGETTTFQVSYQVEGPPRWVYFPAQQLLSNFRLTALANFPYADFASGIRPTEIKEEPGQARRFTWVFDDNVSVKNPFGVFTAIAPMQNTGILPRLLILAPGVLLWWLFLLYLSVPMNMKDVAIASGIFFASILALTYISRVITPITAWTLITPIILALTWGLGKSQRLKIGVIICTITGVILPVLALLVPYSGIVFSIAGLTSVAWLAVRHWYQVDYN